MSNPDGRMKVGVIGTGNISGAYLTHARDYRAMEIVACAALRMEAAQEKAAEHAIKAMGISAMLADPDIEMVINLTLPQSHAEVNADILKAGKHAYCEKPFAVARAGAKAVLELAEKEGLRVGCAPDTFLGGGHQTTRKLLDEGWIGSPVAGTAFMMCPGHESWHPNPGFYYRKGGGPVLDMGPYYITALVNLLGPVKAVSAMSRRSSERTATCEALRGQTLPVEVDTHTAGLIHFCNDTVITLVMSFDVQGHAHNPLELYGTLGSMIIPDPNGFGGTVQVCNRQTGKSFATIPLTHGYADNFRSIGAADMADAIRNHRPHRASGALAYHVLDIMCALDEAAQSKGLVKLGSTCERPAAMPLGLHEGEVSTPPRK